MRLHPGAWGWPPCVPQLPAARADLVIACSQVRATDQQMSSWRPQAQRVAGYCLPTARPSSQAALAKCSRPVSPGGAAWAYLVPTRTWTCGDHGSCRPIVSTDVSGKLRIWDTTQKEHLLKYEYQPFAGKIKDIAWTEDSKRIAVVGEGREK